MLSLNLFSGVTLTELLVPNREKRASVLLEELWYGHNQGQKRRKSKVAKISRKASMKQEHWLLKHLLTPNAWLWSSTIISHLKGEVL